MSSPRAQKYFEGMPQQISRLGKYDVQPLSSAIRWSGVITASTDGFAGYNACVLDFTSATWATLNKRVILVAEPVQDLNKTQSMRTQSHAYNQFMDGSYRFHAYMESPAAPGGANAANLAYYNFVRLVQQHITGQLAAPLEFHFTAVTVVPTVDTVNGASSTATFTATDWLLPWGMAVPGGV